MALPEVNFYLELIDGVVVYPHCNEDTMTAAPIPEHQDVVGNVYTLLREYARRHGGKASSAPVTVALSESDQVQPDVMWLAEHSACTRTDTLYRGAPEWVVEVLSPSTARRDRTEKYALYEMHGVHEYWIVDPHYSLIEVYVREGATFRRMGAYAPADTFESPVLGARTVAVREVFAI